MYIEAHTGLTVNYDKTLIYRIGSLAHSDAKLYTSKEFTWTNDSFNLLGIQIMNDNDEILNYLPVIEKMQGVLQNWSKRNLTLMGRVLIVNTLCESLFVYKLAVTADLSNRLIKIIEQIICDYLWSNPRAHISKRTLQKSKGSSGLRLFDVSAKQKELKIAWL